MYRLFSICMEEYCTDYLAYVWRSLVQTISHMYGGVLYRLFHISVEESCIDYFTYLWRNLLQTISHMYGGVLYRLFHISVEESCIDYFTYLWRSLVQTILHMRERSGSVVECLTRDRRVAGSSLTGVTALWSLSKTHLS